MIEQLQFPSFCVACIGKSYSAQATSIINMASQTICKQNLVDASVSLRLAFGHSKATSTLPLHNKWAHQKTGILKKHFGNKRHSIASSAAATEALSDIDERLERYEWDRMNLADLTGKTALVTGGNSGIGFAICLALARKNANVILTARDPEKGEWATNAINASLKTDKVEFMELDVGAFDKVKSFVRDFKAKDRPIHILVNNAGIHMVGGEAPEHSGQRTPEGSEVTIGTNYWGPFLLTSFLLDNLKANAPSRIVFQGSPAEQLSNGVPWDDLKAFVKDQSDGEAYGLSKLYNIMIAKALNEKLKGTGVEAFSAHPGITRTHLFDKTDKTKPVGAAASATNALVGQPLERGASPLLYATASPELDGQGGAFIGGPVGALAPIANLDQFGDRKTFSSEGKALEDCLRLYDESMRLIQPDLSL